MSTWMFSLSSRLGQRRLYGSCSHGQLAQQFDENLRLLFVSRRTFYLLLQTRIAIYPLQALRFRKRVPCLFHCVQHLVGKGSHLCCVRLFLRSAYLFFYLPKGEKATAYSTNFYKSCCLLCEVSLYAMQFFSRRWWYMYSRNGKITLLQRSILQLFFSVNIYEFSFLILKTVGVCILNCSARPVFYSLILCLLYLLLLYTCLRLMKSCSWQKLGLTEQRDPCTRPERNLPLLYGIVHALKRWKEGCLSGAGSVDGKSGPPRGNKGPCFTVGPGCVKMVIVNLFLHR